ncbi:hypothetical protein LPJ53_003131 [Coemansia erecta]|uniref:NmrA-like domain-containing protein n=1 Tax=Coemansia erecta TaxID=147472 RepID=A0A9W7Y1Z8_9FUNG|nr:hypothetical protein LPJ53_003131 [Coemansia erecta]
MSTANKPTAPYNKIVVVGASGSLASYFIDAFKQAGDEFQVTLLASKQKADKLKQDVADLPQFSVIPVDYNNEAELVDALRNQEVVLSLLAAGGLALQPAVIRAAQKAQVKWIIPSEYGTDHSNKDIQDLLVFSDKIKTRHILESENDIPYTYILTGAFADTFLSPVFKWDLETHSYVVPGDGNKKNSFTPRQDIAAYTLATLRRLDQYRNASVRVASHTLTPNEWVNEVERISGKKLNLQYESADEIRQHIKDNTVEGNYNFEKIKDELALTLAEGISRVNLGGYDLDSDNFHEVVPTPFEQIVSEGLKN